LFFYSYLQIKIQEKELNVKTEDKIEFSKVDSLFESYKRFIKDYNLDKKDILEEIKEYAILFRENFDYDIVSKELTNEYGIERINAIIFGLDTSTLIPYVLFILKKVEDKYEQNMLFQIIESYIMRRMITHATTKNYNQLFTDSLISNEVLTYNKFNKYIDGKSDKVNYMPTDDQIKVAINNSVLVNKQSAGIIYFIESMIRNRSRQATQLLGISKYSLEHLMPKKWENYWGTIENKDERDIRNRKLLTLGNLAIITQSLNASIRDSSWEIKKNGKKDKYGLSHFSGGIETLASYLDIDVWNEEEIVKRANFLFEKATEIWKNIKPEVEAHDFF